MRLRWLVFGLLAVCGLCSLYPPSARAQREEHRYLVAEVADPDGWVHARSGPSIKFPSKRKVNNRELVLVTSWPGDAMAKRLKDPENRASLLAQGMEPQDLSNWRWVILLDRGNPASRAGGEWGYIHASRLKTVRSDGVTWGITTDPDGFQNVRSSPNGEIVGRIEASEAFILLPAEKPYPTLTSPGLPWVPVLTRAGVEGWLKADRLEFHDPRDWQWAGDIPYVEY